MGLPAAHGGGVQASLTLLVRNVQQTGVADPGDGAPLCGKHGGGGQLWGAQGLTAHRVVSALHWPCRPAGCGAQGSSNMAVLQLSLKPGHPTVLGVRLAE